MPEALRIRLRGCDVGLLEYFPARNEYLFSFESSYLNDAQREILGQSFEDVRPNSFTTTGMPAWFQNLLPQDRLRNLVSRGLSVGPKDDFRLLAGLGLDLPGAVEAVPTERRLEPVEDQRAAPVAVPKPGALRFALSGVQLKLSILRGERGLTLPVEGVSGRWIAKFDDPRVPGLPRIEHATMVWAQRTGINIPDIALSHIDEFDIDLEEMETGDGSVFLIRRFDRHTGDTEARIHMEDFAQVFDQMPGDSQYDGSYEQIGAVLARIAPSSEREFLRRLVFCIICGNGDAHLKNWSLLYPAGREVSLSPAYDLVSTILVLRKDNLALTLDGSRKFRNVRLASFQGLADRLNRDWATVREWIIADAERAFEAWPVVREELQYSDRHLFLMNRHVAMSHGRLLG